MPKFILASFYLLLYFFLNTPSIANPDFSHPADTGFTYSSKLLYSIFLIGDAGSPIFDNRSTLKLLQEQLEKSSSNSAVVFLGDNIYPIGLPDSGHVLRGEYELKLVEQMKIAENYTGKVFFIPGNHDWARSGKNGWNWVQNEERFAEAYLKRGNSYLPDHGCPGPVEVSLSKDLVLIVLDTQWWLHRWIKPGKESDCDAHTKEEVITQLENIIKRNIDKKVIVTSHHPMYTYGPHGGRYTIKQHIFPLTDLNRYLYIPLPVAGSLYPLFRTLIGSRQDIAHPLNRQMRKAMINIFKTHPKLIHAAGHEHALQHIVVNNINYIVSGSGCKTTHVVKGKNALFAERLEGFAKLDYYENGEVWVEFWGIDLETNKGKRIYRHLLFK